MHASPRSPARARRSRIHTPAPVLTATIALAAVLSLAVAPAPIARPAGAATVGPATSIRFELEAQGDPAAQAFRTVGVGDRIRYGNGTLQGSTVIAGVPYGAELLVTLEYVDGSGPFTGWWTFTDPVGDRLALAYEGRTTLRSTTTRIAGRVRVIGGTGPLVDVTGSGRVRGVRRTDLGGNVRYTFALQLRGLPGA